MGAAARLSPGPTPIAEIGAEVDNQVAAPAETSTPNLHGAKIAQKECGWKDGYCGGAAQKPTESEERKTVLTHTGLLMEGVSAWPMMGNWFAHFSVRSPKGIM
jgi:hypothetical protein